jgi:predicted membrane chloride channel (bestrophin family)
MFEQPDSWLHRNWVALFAAFSFLMALLKAWDWYVFHKQDDAIDVFFNLFVGVAFVLIHRNRRSEERFREARKQLTDVLEGQK